MSIFIMATRPVVFQQIGAYAIGWPKQHLTGIHVDPGPSRPVGVAGIFGDLNPSIA